MSRFSEAILIDNQEAAKAHFVATLKTLKSALVPKAGQFFMLGLSAGSDPLLKRPFSLFQITSEGFVQILYRVKGKGTRLMRSLKPGTVLKILGPLGKGFPLPAAGKQPLLVGGGLGIVPLVALAESIKQNSPKVFVGARNKDEILVQDVISKTGAHMEIATDDGSHGRRGFVTEMFEDFLSKSTISLSSYVLYGCGPTPMLKSLSDIAGRLGVEGYVSLEEHMACGVGACMGCVVKIKTPAGYSYKRVCKEGPVFPVNEVLFTP